MDDQQIEGDARDHRLDPDLGRVKPVLQLASVEHQLQSADADAQRGKAEEVERLAVAGASLAQKDQDAERRDQPDRQAYVEYPPPTLIPPPPPPHRPPPHR